MPTANEQENLPSVDQEIDEIVAAAREFRHSTAPHFFAPNHIPLAVRCRYLLQSSALIAYGSFGVWIDDIYIPGKRGQGIHVHGIPLLIVYAAMLVAAANFLSVVVDHYDHRNNERNYRKFAQRSEWLAWGLLITALVLDMFVFKSMT